MLKMSVGEIAIVSSCLMRIYTDEEARQKHLKAFLKNGIKTDLLLDYKAYYEEYIQGESK